MMDMKKAVKITLFLIVFSVVLGFGLPVMAGVLSFGCNYHAYRDCAGNSIYWFDSCANRQDLYQNCSGTQICRYGQCTIKSNSYTTHYTKKCYNDNLYWYDSKGVLQDLYKNCADDNECTIDSCSDIKCLNTMKTDCPAPAVPGVSNLAVYFLSKKNAEAIQWDKAVEVAPDSNIYFLVNVSNSSNIQVDNVNISASMPGEITLLGNLKVNDVLTDGDIISGVNIGLLAAGITKAITFEGKTGTFDANLQKQAIVTVNSGGASQTDTIMINFNPSQQQTAAVSSASEDSSFVKFLKRWYLWILIAVALAFLFIVVFRRFSTNV